MNSEMKRIFGGTMPDIPCPTGEKITAEFAKALNVSQRLAANHMGFYGKEGMDDETDSAESD